MKKLIIVLFASCLLLWAAGAVFDQAMADVTSNGATTNDQVNSSGSNTAITGGYSSTASTTYSTGSSSNSTTTNTTNAYQGDSRVVPSASAPAISSMSQDLCTVGISAGGQTFSFGASLGMTKRDLNCERLKLAKALHDMGMKVASIALMCQDSRVFSAMAMSGTSCPYLGSIGTEAQAKWEKYGKLRPDYEEYVKTLRITEQIDNEILEDIDDGQVINYSGGTIKLGNK